MLRIYYVSFFSFGDPFGKRWLLFICFPRIFGVGRWVGAGWLMRKFGAWGIGCRTQLEGRVACLDLNGWRHFLARSPKPQQDNILGNVPLGLWCDVMMMSSYFSFFFLVLVS